MHKNRYPFFQRAGASSLALSFLAVFGCAGEVTSETGVKEQAIWGAADDANTPEANVAVNVGGGCTGTLITPRIVLTAAHCTSPGGTPPIYFGNDSTLFSANQVATTGNVAHPGYHRDDPNAEHPSDFDMALVFLAEPVFARGKITRPTLVDPNTNNVGMAGWSSCGRNINQGNPNQTKRQAAIFQNGVYQSQTGPDQLALRNEPGPEGATWIRDSENTGVCFGDSGGPLFVAHANGTREVFGVTSWVSFYGDGLAIGAGWANITTAPARAWITEHVLDANVFGSRSSAWLTAHGKDAATFWYGEADYTGVCDTAKDPDCDYWYSEHDSLPNAYNPEQEEGGGGPATPCSDLCQNPVAMTNQYYHSGQMGSLATCHETTLPVSGLTCGNLASGRKFLVNGQEVACGTWIQIPAQRNGGYCMQTTAGPYDWAYFQVW